MILPVVLQSQVMSVHASEKLRASFIVEGDTPARRTGVQRLREPLTEIAIALFAYFHRQIRISRGIDRAIFAMSDDCHTCATISTWIPGGHHPGTALSTIVSRHNQP